VARETAADIAADLRSAAEPAVAGAISRVAFMVLAVLMVPVGILILIATFVAFAVVTALIHPTGPVASVFTLAWLLVTLGALVFVFRVIYRRAPRRLRAAWAHGVEPRRATEVIRADRIDAAETTALTSVAAPQPSLAELDARLAPAEPSGARER